MHMHRDFQHKLTFIETFNSPKNTPSHLTQCLNFEKIMIIINSIFEGIGMAGIISAAFWYATAPIAPNGFNGPIAALTIAITTVISLLIAIPISYCAYTKAQEYIENFLLDYKKESKYFDDLLETLYFDLLRYRFFFASDKEFLHSIKALLQNDFIKKVSLSISTIYSCYKDMPVNIMDGMDSNVSQRLAAGKAMKLSELMHSHSLVNIRALRKNVIKKVFDSRTRVKFQAHKNANHSLKNMSLAMMAGVTCVEVLLSIGWTVASILIGLKIVMPISSHSWMIFALFCIALGPIFGVGIYFNKYRQSQRDVLKDEIEKQNKHLDQAREMLDGFLAKKIIECHDIVQVKVNPQLSFKIIQSNHG